jgi:hypothetical protein
MTSVRVPSFVSQYIPFESQNDRIRTDAHIEESLQVEIGYCLENCCCVITVELRHELCFIVLRICDADNLRNSLLRSPGAWLQRRVD